MAAGDCDTPARAVGSSASAPTAIRRTTSSPPGLQGPSLLSFAQGAASSGVSVTRVQSTQERINEILEVGRQRADSLSLHIRSPRRASIMSVGRMPPSSGHVGEPDERTSFAVAGNTMNYQSTQTTSNLRSRQPPPTPAMDPASQHGGTTQGTEEKKHWVWDSLDGFWSFELENKGSVARDHLAVERTFLAWLRTSLAFTSIGIAITQLFRLNMPLDNSQGNYHFQRLGKPLGTTFIGVSILVLLLGYQRFYQPQQWLLKGKFPASRGPIILISFVAFGLMVASLIVVIVVQPPYTH